MTASGTTQGTKICQRDAKRVHLGSLLGDTRKSGGSVFAPVQALLIRFEGMPSRVIFKTFRVLVPSARLGTFVSRA